MQVIRTRPSQTGCTQGGNPKWHKTTRVHPRRHLGTFSHRRLRRQTVLIGQYSPTTSLSSHGYSPSKAAPTSLAASNPYSTPQSDLNAVATICTSTRQGKISPPKSTLWKDHGIALPTTATELHQQNGIAERLNGIILEWLTATLASLNAETPPKY